ALLKLQSERVTLTVAGQTVTRQFILTSTSVEDKGNILRGAYRETVWGFSPQPATVVGTFALRRPVFGAAQTNPDDPNTPPVAVDDAVATQRDQPVTINVLGNDSDADGDPLTVSAIGAPLHGTATTDGQTITYTPNPNFVGVDSFTYTVLDGRGGAATATVTVTVSGPPGSNRAPTAGKDSATTAPGAPVIIDVLANDADPDGDALTITIATPPSNGTAVVESGKIVYTPSPGFVGTDSFTYIASDGKGGAATATVTVTVTDQPGGGGGSLYLPLVQR
ncbi:MAG: tandem-95 repeat protein, partial [Caldilineaceae bacterium]|nr:tandem-95 repeat protein [Caldilineaceae bacterium]